MGLHLPLGDLNLLKSLLTVLQTRIVFFKNLGAIPFKRNYQESQYPDLPISLKGWESNSYAALFPNCKITSYHKDIKVYFSFE